MTRIHRPLGKGLEGSETGQQTIVLYGQGLPKNEVHGRMLPLMQNTIAFTIA